jgi:hypothetical protein
MRPPAGRWEETEICRFSEGACVCVSAAPVHIERVKRRRRQFSPLTWAASLDHTKAFLAPTFGRLLRMSL